MGEKHNKKLWTRQVQFDLMKEDQILRIAVQLIGNDKWNDISEKYQQMFRQKYGQNSQRTGKKCRQRWYNKLHPALQKNLEEWTQDQFTALIDGYKEMGPKWAKIIIRLFESGFIRRSDNGVKNHFHMLVKRKIKELNNFVQNYNQKCKENGLFYQKPKKKYFYPKIYSIERMLKKKTPVSASSQVPEQERKQSNEPCIVDVQNERQNLAEKQGQGTTQKLEEVRQQQNIVAENQQDNPGILNDLNISGSQIMSNQPKHIQNDNKNNFLVPLKPIDKLSVDRMLLWVHDKAQGRVQIMTSTQIDQNDLMHVRNSFLQYLKDSSQFTPQQIKILVEELYNYSRCCKKLGKKVLCSKMRKKQTLTKYQISKAARKLFFKIIERFPQIRNTFMKNKSQIHSRIHALAEKIHLKQKQLEEEIKKKYFLRKQEEEKIISIILDETRLLHQTQLQQEGIRDQLRFQRKLARGKKCFRLEYYAAKNGEQNGEQQNASNIQKTKRIRRIRRPSIKPPLKIKSDLEQKQGEKQIPIMPKQSIPSDKVKVNQDEQYVSKIKFFIDEIPQVPEEKFTFSQFLHENEQEQPPCNKIVLENIITIPVQIKEQEMQRTESLQLEHNLIKFKEKCKQQTEHVLMNIFKANDDQKIVEKVTFQNASEMIEQKGSLKKYPSSQLVFKIPIKKPHQEKHIESQHSQYSLKSKRSLRPNRILVRQEQKVQESQNILKKSTSIKQQGSFENLKKDFPDVFIRSFEIGQQGQLNKSSKFYNQQDPESPLNSNRSNFMAFNMQANNHFTSNQGNNDFFKHLSGSQQFIGFNNSGFRKESSTNFNTTNRPKSIFKSCDFLAMSCQNFGQSKVAAQNKALFQRQKDNQALGNSFLRNIRNIEENNNNQWKQKKVFNFVDNLPERFQKQTVQTPVNNSNKGFAGFSLYNSQPIEFQIPQKLIETAKNSNFPIRNYNDYSQNYQHINSMQFSKVMQFDKRFGFNSARLSQIQLFKSEDRIDQNRSRSKQYDAGSNMFKSQRIQSMQGSCQFLNKSRQLSNSCIYSSHDQKSLFGSRNQQNLKNLPHSYQYPNAFGSMEEQGKQK